jgi:hypothetical protein
LCVPNKFDRFGFGALEYAIERYKISGEEEGTKLKRRIVEVKKKLKTQAF